MRSLFFLLVLPIVSHANTQVVGRYSRLVDAPITSPLDAPVSKFVAATTVGDAVRLVLVRTGYQLAPARHTDPMQSELFGKRLPAAHQDLSSLTAEQALVALGKPGYRVMVDHVHRLIGFEVRPRYRNYQITASNSASDVGANQSSKWSCTGNAGAWQCVAVQS